jgi:hypothetical protein
MRPITASSLMSRISVVATCIFSSQYINFRYGVRRLEISIDLRLFSCATGGSSKAITTPTVLFCGWFGVVVPAFSYDNRAKKGSKSYRLG